ncbi:MAG: Gfo/Idh/MocA family protein [Planctomycetota bacterium]|jgi:predicted dehydrogenase
MKNSRPKQTTRRDFLSKTAAVTVGGSLLASCSGVSKHVPKAAQRTPLGANEPIKMGMIGLGGMGGGHLRSAMQQSKDGITNVQVVALAEVAQPRLENALEQARTQGAEITVDGYADYKQLLERDDIHCVLIASPEHWHAQMTVDAIAAGKDVYLEKPMTLRLDDAIWLKETVEANPDMLVQVGTQYMMRKKYHRARELIKSGTVGHPVTSQTSYCRNSKNGEWLYGIDENLQPGENLDWEAWCGPLGVRDWDTEIFHRWRRYKEYSTGIIGDLLVHQMTPLMYATDAGWPVRVSASGGHFIDKAMENHDQVTITVDFENDHSMVVTGSTCNERGLVEMIRGHKANILLGSNNCVMQPERIFVDDIEAETIECERINEQPALRLDWLNSVRSREPNFSQVAHATKVMVIVDLATRSLWEGKAFTFDPRTMNAAPA